MSSQKEKNLTQQKNATWCIQTQLRWSFLESLLHPGVVAYRLSMLTQMFEMSLALHAAVPTARKLSSLHLLTPEDLLWWHQFFIHRRSHWPTTSALRYLHNVLGQTLFLNSTVHSDTYCSVAQHFVPRCYPCSGSSYTTRASSNVLHTFWEDAAGSCLFTMLEREMREEWHYYGGLLMSAVGSFPVRFLIYMTR